MSSDALRQTVVAEQGKPRPATSISHVTADGVEIRGLDLCRDLIGQMTFSEYFLLLLTGERPAPTLTKVVDAAMIAIAEHGLVPSVQAARMTLRAAPDALQGAVAAGLLGCGPVILGAAEDAGAVLAEIVAGSKVKPLEQAVREHLQALRDAKASLPGFGHSVHRGGDPRAARLIAYAAELGVRGVHCAALAEMERQVESVFGRKLPANVSAAIPAVLLDAGFPLTSMRGIPLIARCAGLVAHLAEEKARPISAHLSGAAARAVDYEPGH
jgi:citrate synthase